MEGTTTNTQRHTADEGFAGARPRTLIAPWITETAFIGFLLLIFVSLEPFALRDPAVLALGESGFSGAGDVWRQVLYLAVFAVIAASTLDRRGLSAIEAVPVLLVVLLGWCVLSAAWAAEPGITVRRVGLEFVIVLSAMLGVSTLGVERSLRLLYWVLAGVLVVNWVSIFVLPQAIHLSNEIDPSLIGDWRGLYFHKNIAGSVSAISALIFLYYAFARRSWIDGLLFVGAAGFMIGTRSKSSIGLLPVAIVFGAIYRAAWKRGLDKAIVSIAFLLALALVAIVLRVDAAGISRLLEDPTEFTGRTAIWHAEIAFIHDHLLLGSGFGSFADTGSLSPLHNYVSGSWIETVAHGHNAYLQLLVTIGGVGFALAMLCFVVFPGIAFWRTDASELALKSLFFSIFVFMLLHNFLESDFLEGDGPAWVAFLLMLAMMRPLRRQTAVAHG